MSYYCPIFSSSGETWEFFFAMVSSEPRIDSKILPYVIFVIISILIIISLLFGFIFYVLFSICYLLNFLYKILTLCFEFVADFACSVTKPPLFPHRHLFILLSDTHSFLL